MWRADKKREADETPSAVDPVESAWGRNGQGGGQVGQVYSTDSLVEPTRDAWRAEIAAIGGPSPLIAFDDSPRSRIELSTTHPGGLAQFITGNSTLLSSLIRDELALRNARIAAGAITDKGVELRSVRGIDSVHLAIGLAEWRGTAPDAGPGADGGAGAEQSFRAPVLLRPISVRRYGRDFELKLRGAPFVNPVLARRLQEQFQITLDRESLVALAASNGVFKPQPVIDRLRSLTSHLAWFQVHPRLVVSSFADVASDMLADSGDLAHPVLDALAGNLTSRRGVQDGYHPIDPSPQDHRAPSTDTLLLDADGEQENVIAQIAGGNSLVVKTLPGTGGTQTIVNAIGALVAQNKRVLVVSPRRLSLGGINRRLSDVGLPGVAVSPRTLRRDLIQSIGRNEKAAQPRVADVDEALVRLRSVLLDYRTSMSRVDPLLKVSVLDALRELARLALLPNPPATTARLDRPALESLASGRQKAAKTLSRAAELGQFRYGPDDSPWYGAQFSSGDDAHRAHALAKRLNNSDLPKLLTGAYDLIGQTRMRPFTSLTELGTYLRLLADLRETLDKFLPVVFDRSLTDLIAATSPRRDAPQMSSTSRRRLKSLAKEYVRPGVHIGDINESLRRIQQQRTLWYRFAAAGIPPEIPVGINDVQMAFQRVTEDLAQLDLPLGTVGTSKQLGSLPIDQLIGMIEGLAAESEVLANLQERTELLDSLREHSLDPLLVDLSNRHVPEHAVPDELELAWWQSVLELMLANDRALLGANTGVLDRLEGDFRLVDEAHASMNGQLLAWQLAETWSVGILDHPMEATALKQLLRGDGVSSFSLHEAAPHLGKVLAPVWLASPYEVSQITDAITFDTVVLVDAGATTLAENVGAIRRARQVVAFGDPVTQTPSHFEVAIRPVDDQRTRSRDDASLVDELHSDSALARLADLVPTLSLTRSYRAGGEDLAELVNHRFYGGKIDSLPWAGTFLGHGSLALHYVEGRGGMPDSETGAVESVDAEVDEVVSLVLDHAINYPRESLMVITASPKHAVRVQQAVLAAFAKRSDLADFVLKERAEPFMVATLEQSVAQSRDRVIFSVGYGKTAHGRVLTNFGGLARPGGERLLAVGMTRARRSMDIVSCFTPADIDEDRMNFGVVALRQILQEAESGPTPDTFSSPGDALLIDLARRLGARGLDVAFEHRGKLTLVASHDGRAIAIETDAVVHSTSLRESLRLRPDMLRRLGWHYLRVHSFELFTNPEAVAARIANVLGVRELALVETQPISF
ncbi:AAA family ATPase [Herbiconiux sp. CPCC 203407]|uniref:AAA family ATPase n=1 Tax=Herbiconiux oxytropis TaxID=2970915 RepID=A0AA41XEC9_9MICO|nr:AAA family ATPase [Herbiconiux oxytropis]MCS5721043.1 AAA family ATPase [Herbiconiux oxytropis]MCS5724695.1 AAA family ATPase [Herbiconiux oxytropis]